MTLLGFHTFPALNSLQYNHLFISAGTCQLVLFLLYTKHMIKERASLIIQQRSTIVVSHPA